MHRHALDTPEDVSAALDEVGYLPDEGLATAAYLALRMHRPLFLEGEAGVGKTALAHALAEVTGRADLIRLQCYEGLEASQALYDWDFPRQLLHLRAAEAAHADRRRRALEASLYDRRFLLARPLLQALEDRPRVLLVDEIDRADDEFEAFLLEVLSDFTSPSPSSARSAPTTPPLVVLTSQPHPRGARRAQAPLPLPLARAPRLRPRGRDPAAPAARGRPSSWPARSPRATAAAAHRWTCSSRPASPRRSTGRRALHALGARDLDPDARRAHARRGAKYREDTDRVHALPGGRSSVAAPDGQRDVVDTRCRRVRPHAAARRRGRRRRDRVEAMLAALGSLDVLDATTSTGPAGSRCAPSPDDLDRYDAAFAAYFAGEPPAAPCARRPGRTGGRRRRVATPRRRRRTTSATRRRRSPTQASADEVLRHRDVAELTAAERDDLRRLFALLRPPRRCAPARRRRRPRRGGASTRRAPCARCCATAAR